MRTTIDASVYVSALRPLDVNHILSKQFLVEHEANGEEAIEPALVIPECGGAVARASADSLVGRRAAIAIRSLLNHTFVPITTELALLASELAADNPLRGADSVYVATSLQFGTTLITWDNEMLLRSPSTVPTMTPADWLISNPQN